MLYCILFLAAVTAFTEYQVLFPEKPNFYNILGVNRDASVSEIKKAYKKQSLVYHPDKNPSPDAADQFLRLQQAYEVLSDASQRKTYDRFGEDFLKHQHKDKPENDLFLSTAVHYIIWGLLTYVLTTGKSNSQGRSWSYTGLIVLLVLEVQMLLSDFDPLRSIFPSMLIKEQIDFLHHLYPVLMNGCRVISQCSFVDFETENRQLLAAVFKNQEVLLLALVHLQNTIDRKAGKKPQGDADVLDAGLGQEERAGENDENIPIHLRMRRAKTDLEKAKKQQEATDNKAQKGRIPGWLWMIGLYVVLNYVFDK